MSVLRAALLPLLTLAYFTCAVPAMAQQLAPTAPAPPVAPVAAAPPPASTVDPPSGPPRFQPFVLGDASGAGPWGLPAAFVLEQLRLGLTSEAPLSRLDPGCSESAEAATGGGGFSVQRARALQLVPHLTLAGFSRTGCLSAGVGVAVVYTAQLRKDMSVALSAGSFRLPHGAPDGTAVTVSQVRADLVLPRPHGRAYSVGVSVSPARTLLNFGGRW